MYRFSTLAKCRSCTHTAKHAVDFDQYTRRKKTNKMASFTISILICHCFFVCLLPTLQVWKIHTFPRVETKILWIKKRETHGNGWPCCGATQYRASATELTVMDDDRCCYQSSGIDWKPVGSKRSPETSKESLYVWLLAPGPYPGQDLHNIWNFLGGNNHVICCSFLLLFWAAPLRLMLQGCCFCFVF